MKRLLNSIIVLVLISFSFGLSAQPTPVKGANILYFNQSPVGYTPIEGCCSEIAYNFTTQEMSFWDRGTQIWDLQLFMTGDERTKLTGIEGGATADQTAAEILALLLTVDGSGSNIDADRLDGIEGGSTLNTGQNWGSGYIPHVGADGVIEIGKIIDLHHVTADGEDYTIRLSTTGTPNELTLNGNKIWHLANDGSGSGLDADLLAGVAASLRARTDITNTFTVAQNIEGRVTVSGLNSDHVRLKSNTTGDAAIAYLSFYLSDDTRLGYVGYGSASNKDLYITNDEGDIRIINEPNTLPNANFLKTVNNVVTAGYWTSEATAIKSALLAVDGAGSSLDADFLDGIQGGSLLSTGQSWSGNYISHVGVDGVMEVGRILDFHHTSLDGVDYAVRLSSTATPGQLQIDDTHIIWHNGNLTNVSQLLNDANYAKTNATNIFTVAQNITGRLTLSGLNSDNLRLQSSTSGDASVAYVSYYDNLGARKGYVGYGSTGNSDMYILNEEGQIRMVNEPNTLPNANFLKTVNNVVTAGYWTSEATAIKSALLAVDGAGSSLDADFLDGIQGGSLLSTGQSWTGNYVPHVGVDGVMEIGRYVDFHHVTDDGIDKIARLSSTGVVGELQIESNKIWHEGTLNGGSYTPSYTSSGGGTVTVTTNFVTYQRIGNTAYVEGVILVNASVDENLIVDMSLPVVSNLGGLAGDATYYNNGDSGTQNTIMTADATNNTAQIFIDPQAAAQANAVRVSFSYTIQ